MIQINPSINRTDMIRCALCGNAACNKACEKLRPSRLLRSIWFGNEQTAVQRLPEENPCLTCSAPCENACVRPGEVPIRDLVNRLYYQVKPNCETPLPENEDRLKCELCGIPLENPFLPWSPAPMTCVPGLLRRDGPASVSRRSARWISMRRRPATLP